MYAVARSEWKPLKSRIIRWVVKQYDVDLSEAVVKDAELYPSFNAFFTRQLESSARPLAAGQNIIVSPVDGEVSQAAPIEQGRMIQAKGRDYSLLELLGGDEWRSQDSRQSGKFTKSGWLLSGRYTPKTNTNTY